MTEPFETRRVFGFDVAVSDVAAMADYLAARAAVTDAPVLVAAADVHVMTRAVHEPAYGACLACMDVICPDGMPIVWRLNRGLSHGGKRAARISGPDLMTAMLAHSGQSPLRHFLLGGDEELLQTLREKLARQFPDACIAGAYSPPFCAWGEADLRAIRERIAASRANVVWVGLGCPKQEHWMASQKELLPPAVYAGVGAAFAFHAGTVKRAPLWMQRCGLEWLYRIYREPGRLLKRYLKHNSLFVWYLLRGK